VFIFQTSAITEKKSCACYWYETKLEIVGILLILPAKAMFSHINGKLSSKPFELYGSTEVYLEPN